MAIRTRSPTRPGSRSRTRRTIRDYTSGANNVTAAMTRTLALFFGTDQMTFEVTSLSPLAINKTRVYERFSDAARDVVDARIYLGFHFRFADTAARTQGTRVADWTFNHFLLPLDDSGASSPPLRRAGRGRVIEG